MSPRNEGLHLFASPLTGLENPPKPPRKNGYNPALQSTAENVCPARTNSDTETENSQVQPDAASFASTSRGFHKHHEARPIELFYDLFFVANLTSFTYIHPVNDAQSLSSYVAFFSALWFTWLQVTLYDVRFGNDSIAERLFKGIQLGGMVGFSVLGPKFLPEYFAKDNSIQQAYALILMGTRLCLTLQYICTEWLARSERGSRRPLSILAATYFSAAVIYAIMAGALSRNTSPNAYIAFYVIAILETVVNIIVSSKWKIVSFRETHLVERMSLLTLIIIGEGVIVLMKSIQYVVKNPNVNTATTAGLIIAIVVTYYLLYMLYFDKLRRGYFGLVREQIWAFLHFPFHVALVLVVEGVNEMFLFRKIFEQDLVWNSKIVATLRSHAQPNETLYIREAAQDIADWTVEIFKTFPDVVVNGTEVRYLSNSLSTLTEFNGTTSAETDEAYASLDNAVAYARSIIFYSYGTEESSSDAALEPIPRLEELVGIFQLVFGYVFIAAGFVLILLALMTYLNRGFRRKLQAQDWVSIGTHVVLGVGLTLISTMLVDRDPPINAPDPVLFKFGQSPWVIPLIIFCLGIAFLVDLVISARNLKNEGETGKSTARAKEAV